MAIFGLNVQWRFASGYGSIIVKDNRDPRDVEFCNDLNGDDQVTIDQVQKVINAFLDIYS